MGVLFGPVVMARAVGLPNGSDPLPASGSGVDEGRTLLEDGVVRKAMLCASENKGT